jgi:hypothetical protein
MQASMKLGVGTLIDAAKATAGHRHNHPAFAQQDRDKMERDEHAMLPYAGSVL